MRTTVCLFGIVLVAAMILTTGCESDDSIDSVAFRNNSSYKVTVTIVSSANQSQTFTLSPNGGTAEYSEIFVGSYTYKPTSTVVDHRDGDEVTFENRL